jgi:hypothetical protein
MKALALGFHSVFAAIFATCAFALARVALRGHGFGSALPAACATAATALALLNARASLHLARAAELRPLPARPATSSYLEGLISVVILAIGGQRAQMASRVEVFALCLASALWLLALTFKLVPGQWISRTHVIDYLGRALPLSALQWFELNAIDPAKTRVVLEAGDVGRVIFRARIAGPADGIRRALRIAGLTEGAPAERTANRNGH